MKKIYDPARKIYQPVITEEMVLREIMERLTYAGVHVWRIVERIPWGKRKSTPGVSDLAGVVPKGSRIPPNDLNPIGYAIPVFGEIKRPGGKRRPSQEAFIAERKAEGCIAGFWENWEHVRQDFAKFGIELPQ